ncbi:hypothetical protein I4U23_027143 [Adineta vaga]|nr:hypothetical protein I4U23_027143 [Adineta vaga]
MFELSNRISGAMEDVDISGRSRSVVSQLVLFPTVTPFSIDEESTEKNISQPFWNKSNDKKSTGKSITLRKLLRFARPLDIFLIIFGTLAALGHGSAQPLLILIFGNLIQILINQENSVCPLNQTAILQQNCPPNIQTNPIDFNSNTNQCNLSSSNINENRLNLSGEANQISLYIVGIACGVIVLGYIQNAFWNISAQRQIRSIRKKLFQAIIYKEIAFFDTHKTGELSTYLTDNINKIHNGIGDKFSNGIKYFASFITGIIIGFSEGWKLSLVILSFSPLIFVIAMLFSKFTVNLTILESKAYEKAGAIAEEVFSSIRTVFAYNGQNREKERYGKHLNEAKKSSIRRGMVNGLIMGFMCVIIFSGYALGFWYGTKLTFEKEYNIGNVVIIFFAIINAVFDLGQAFPQFQAVIEARTAAYPIWQLIDEFSITENSSDEGIIKDELIGDIQFSHVHFCYPSQPDTSILNDLSFNVQHGQTVALVGTSGSGKSTCLQLLQRFWELNSGSIMIDNIQINEYNLKWLRQNIGVVSQEPVLFHGTIQENILFGQQSATDEDIQQAAKMANAHSFIMTLPDKYNTLVGEHGAALSGGQKQRIAIARALIRNPSILILDEATSALDNESEHIVQEALNRVTGDRTTLVIAHRLSTIRNADKIIVIHNGKVVEEGNHDKLMSMKSIYYNLVERQKLLKVKEEEEEGFERQEIIRTISEPRTRFQRLRALSSCTSTILDASIMKELKEIHHEEIIDTNQKSKKKKDKISNITFTILKMNKSEWIFILFGCLAAICSGGIQPLFSAILSKLIAAFEQCENNEQEKSVHTYIILFIVIGVVRFISIFFQTFLFGYSGAALTKRLRLKIFSHILRQEIAYFDQTENNTGALCTRLSAEASAVQGATGVFLGVLFQNFASLGISILISFIFSWQMTLIVVIFVPFIVLGGLLQSRLSTKFENKTKQILEDAGQISIESIQNRRTVASLSVEEYICEKYFELIDKYDRLLLKRSHILAIMSSITNSCIFFCWASLFAAAVYLIEKQIVSFQSVLLVITCVIFGIQSLSETSLMSSDYGKAKHAAENILKFLSRKPLIDNESNDGEEIKDFRGEIEFDGVYFTYSNRSNAIILQDFNLTVEAGKKIALVGVSGCGKSTSIQLIERFYDTSIGQLLIDSKNIQTLNLQWYRSQLGIVSQEPVLFNTSIHDNIAYGDTSRSNIPFEEIVQAAKDANIHDFIRQLPQGYETNCGANGNQLSGGQKQRIAIARALIRNPKILLLDEATSALDSESEKLVQEALDKAQQNRTTVIIAHRLSTIQNADVICVIHKGKLVEKGTHEELIAQNGRYYRLVHGKLQ